MFKAVLPPPPPVTSERSGLNLQDSKVFSLKPERLSVYKDFEEMDSEIVELSSALDIYADFIVSAPTSDVYNVEFQGEGLELEGDIVEEMEERIGIKEKVHQIARSLAKFGDQFTEIICSDWCVEKIKNLPPAEMFINFDAKGNPDEDWPFYQFDQAAGKEVAKFAPWEIAHFKVGDSDYGTKDSILYKLRRTYRVLRMLEDTVLVTRVTRSHQRAVYKIDVTGMGEKEAAEYIRKLKILNKRKLYFSASGKLKTDIDPLASQEDIYVPVRKGGVGGDFQTIGGDPNIGEIRDVEHFHSKLFAGTKVPKAYLGFEGDVASKATLYQQHIAFVKVIKRYRYAMALGLKRIYKIEFLLGGINPNDFSWKIVFPNIGAPDEEAAWAIESVKADVIQKYGSLGIKLPVEWVVRKLMMNLTSDEADYLIAAMQNPDAGPMVTQKQQSSPFMVPLDPNDLSKGFAPAANLGMIGAPPAALATVPPANAGKTPGPGPFKDGARPNLGLIMQGRQVFNDTATEALARKVEMDPFYRKMMKDVETMLITYRRTGERRSLYRY